MATNRKNVYLVKLGPKSFGNGRWRFARIKHLIWDQLLATKAEIIQSYTVFLFCVRNRRFCNLEFLFLFTFEGNIQCAKKGITSPCNALMVTNNIVLLRQKQWWNFLGKIVKTLALAKNPFNACKFIFL